MYPFKNSTDVAVAFVYNRFFKAKKQMYGSDWQDTSVLIINKTTRGRKKHMNFRITDDVSEHDVNEIHRMLNEYNLVHREKSKNPDRALF